MPEKTVSINSYHCKVVSTGQLTFLVVNHIVEHDLECILTTGIEHLGLTVATSDIPCALNGLVVDEIDGLAENLSQCGTDATIDTTISTNSKTIAKDETGQICVLS